MSSAEHNPVAAFNQVLSEVIDLVQDVKQAHRKVPETHALHTELDQLFADLGSWARLLMDRDEALGISALAFMPSVAGRKPPNLWPGAISDGDARDLVADHLGRLEDHLSAALAEQDEPGLRTALSEVEQGLRAHRQALAQL
ncbi:MAG: hypothetical protein M3083_22690 [Actinomycetota bacterium]|nr:hypothetical protein [Actinomycetota bacterium]